MHEKQASRVEAARPVSDHDRLGVIWRHLLVKDHVKMPARYEGMVRAVAARMRCNMQLPSVPAHTYAHSLCLQSHALDRLPHHIPRQLKAKKL